MNFGQVHHSYSVSSARGQGFILRQNKFSSSVANRICFLWSYDLACDCFTVITQYVTIQGMRKVVTEISISVSF